MLDEIIWTHSLLCLCGWGGFSLYSFIEIFTEGWTQLQIM